MNFKLSRPTESYDTDAASYGEETTSEAAESE